MSARPAPETPPPRPAAPQSKRPPDLRAVEEKARGIAQKMGQRLQFMVYVSPDGPTETGPILARVEGLDVRT